MTEFRDELRYTREHEWAKEKKRPHRRRHHRGVGIGADTNAEVRLSPELINTDPYGRGWLVKVGGGPGQLEELMAAAYRSFVSAEESRAG